jgi:hypothetical protein
LALDEDSTSPDNGTGGETLPPSLAVGQHPEFKYRDQGGLMKALNWTGATLVGLPVAALTIFIVYKVSTKKKGK